MKLGPNIGKKELFKALKAAIPSGPLRDDALKKAASFGIKRTSLGKLPKSQATKLLKEMKDEHLLKSRLGENKITTADAAPKRLLDTLMETNRADAVSAPTEAARLAEKKEILKDAGLKLAPAKNIRIQKALDTSFVDARREEQEKKEERMRSPWEKDENITPNPAAEKKSDEAIDLPI
jgi:hypothetical protein